MLKSRKLTQDGFVTRPTQLTLDNSAAVCVSYTQYQFFFDVEVRTTLHVDQTRKYNQTFDENDGVCVVTVDYIQDGREVTVHPDNTHLRLNINLHSIAQHAV